MKVLLKGWYGQENLGDDLLFFEVMKALYSDNEVKVVGDESGLKRYKQQFPKMTFSKKYSSKTGYLDIITTDALVLGGGGLYPKVRYSIRTYLDLLFAILLQKQVYIFSIGINPQKRGVEKRIWNFIASRASYMSVRDELSLKLFDAGNVKMCYDLFFINNDPIVKLPILENITRKIAIVGLAHPFSERDVEQNAYIKTRYLKLVNEVSRAVQHLSRLNYQIVFLPFLLKNDRAFINDVKNHSSVENSIVLEFNRDYQISEINSVYKYADFCLGMRFHSKVLAINNCINFAGICYDFKSEALLDQVGISDMGIRYGISNENFFGEEIDLNDGELISLIDKALEKKEENIRKITRALEVIKKRSEINRSVLESIR